MTSQHYMAIIAMLAIVVVCYALKNDHGPWLLDLFVLALALAAPRQELAIGAVALVVAVRHTPLARGLADTVPLWALALLLPGACDMSISAGAAAAAEGAYKARISAGESNDETAETSRPVAENEAELIYFGETQALARLVAAGAIGLTVAVKVGAGAKSGARYQRRSREVKERVEQLRNHYPAGSDLTKF